MAEQNIAEIAKRLAEPFPSEDVEWRVGSTDNKDNPTKGIALAYITNRAVMQRLDEVVGIGNWKNEFHVWRNNGVLCGLSVRIREEWVTKWDGSDESDMEAIKGGFSDAMKRASYQWGIGRYLYNLPNVWVPVEKRGRTTVLKQEPKLPDWALPESERGKARTSTTPATPPPQPPTNTNSAKPLPLPATKTIETPPATPAEIQAMLNERKRRENGWVPIIDALKAKGMPDAPEGATDEQKAALLDEYITKLTKGDVIAVTAKLKELPFKGAGKKAKPVEGA